MVFEFFGEKKKAVIAMAHIGALPGTALYDADGGMTKLIDGVLADVEKLQSGGVDAIMFGNEDDRPYVFKAPLEGVAAMTTIVQAVKPELKVPFGVNCRIPSPASRSAARRVRALCARYSPACLRPTWVSGSPTARARRNYAAISIATT